MFDPFDDTFVNDPYPVFATLREREPVHRSKTGAWVLSRYSDVIAALGDSRLGNAPSPYAVVNPRNRHRYVCADVANNIIPFIDPPTHSLPRKLISKTFHEHLKRNPPDIKKLARQLIQPYQSSGEFDVVNDFGTPLSVSVISQILGIPKEDELLLKQWSTWFFYLFTMIPSEEVRKQLDEVLTQFRDYFAGLISSRRASLRDDLISGLILARDEGQGLSEAQLIDNCMLLFSDGVENVDSAIANAVAILLQYPDQMELLRSQSELLPSAVDECLRYESPAQFIGRVVLEDIPIHGVTIPAKSTVLLMLASANRDPEKFEQADRFNIMRAPNPYLSFGKGRHACVGGSLVRMEMEAALAVILEYFPGLAMKEDTLTWTPRLGHRWLDRLLVHN